MPHRKQHDSRFKAQVAIEAIKNLQTIAQIASEYGIHPNQVSQWKKQVLEALPQLFANGRSKATSDNEQLVAELYRQIGQRNFVGGITSAKTSYQSGSINSLTMQQLSLNPTTSNPMTIGRRLLNWNSSLGSNAGIKPKRSRDSP